MKNFPKIYTFIAISVALLCILIGAILTFSSVDETAAATTTAAAVIEIDT